MSDIERWTIYEHDPDLSPARPGPIVISGHGHRDQHGYRRIEVVRVTPTLAAARADAALWKEEATRHARAATKAMIALEEQRRALKAQ